MSEVSERMLEGKRRKAEERRQEEERLRLEREAQEAQQLETQQKERALHERHLALTSFVKGIYEELNRLSGKRPREEVSRFTLDRTNRAIQDLRRLIENENDPYFDELNQFEPAGDLPETGDVLMMLRMVMDALNRMEARHYSAWNPPPKRSEGFPDLSKRLGRDY